jgi:hypothetical protein
MSAFPGVNSLGYVKESAVLSASAVSLSTGTAKTVTSMSLDPGAWDVSGIVDFQFGATTSYTAAMSGTSQTADTLGAADTFACLAGAADVPTAANDIALTAPEVRMNITVPTTIYLIAKAVFTVSTLKAYGTLRARKVR